LGHVEPFGVLAKNKCKIEAHAPLLIRWWLSHIEQIVFRDLLLRRYEAWAAWQFIISWQMWFAKVVVNYLLWQKGIENVGAVFVR
jgi:hypothetical protein